MSNKKSKRKSIRAYMRSIRNSLTLREKYIAAQLLTNKIIAINQISQATHIAIYVSFDNEINTTLLIKTLLLMHKKIYLPIIPVSNSQYLLFSKYKLSTPLIRNHLNIYEPKWTHTSIISTEILDIMFIPLVAFDNYGNRLGMGGGFYDRTLQQNLKSQFPYKPIGLAYDFQKIPTQLLFNEQWDIKLPEIITPSNHWNWNISQ